MANTGGQELQGRHPLQENRPGEDGDLVAVAAADAAFTGRRICNKMRAPEEVNRTASRSMTSLHADPEDVDPFLDLYRAGASNDAESALTDQYLAKMFHVVRDMEPTALLPVTVLLPLVSLGATLKPVWEYAPDGFRTWWADGERFSTGYVPHFLAALFILPFISPLNGLATPRNVLRSVFFVLSIGNIRLPDRVRKGIWQLLHAMLRHYEWVFQWEGDNSRLPFASRLIQTYSPIRQFAIALEHRLYLRSLFRRLPSVLLLNEDQFDDVQALLAEPVAVPAGSHVPSLPIADRFPMSAFRRAWLTATFRAKSMSGGSGSGSGSASDSVSTKRSRTEAERGGRRNTARHAGLPRFLQS